MCVNFLGPSTCFAARFPKPNYEATNTMQLYCNFHARTELFLGVLRNNTAMGLLSIRGGVAKGLKAGERGGGFVRLPRAAESKGRQKEYFK